MPLPLRVFDYKISIHALREEGDPYSGYAEKEARRFLSTPSARRATGVYVILLHEHRNFYPRPPRGGRLQIRPRFLRY